LLKRTEESQARLRLPDTNREFWTNKIKRNIENDIKSSIELKRLGWDVFTIWECQIKKRDIDNLKNEIANYFYLPSEYPSRLRWGKICGRGVWGETMCPPSIISFNQF
jgi:hypothetical protein